jgi:hypothetical protein
MTEVTTFLSAELTEIGLMAAADPHFAERLVEALRRLPAARTSEPVDPCETPKELLAERCA